MYAYSSMSYKDAYDLPIPIRKWLIQKFNQRMKEEQEMINKNSRMGGKRTVDYNMGSKSPPNMSNFMGPTRK